MESLFAKSYLHFLKFRGFEEYNNILEEFFKDNPQNEIYLELKNISDNDIETFKYFENYFKNSEVSFDEEKFKAFLMSGIKKEYDETDDIAKFASKCYNLCGKLPERLSYKEPFLALKYFEGYLEVGEAKARKNIEQLLSDYNDIENYKPKETIKAEKLEYEVIHNKNNLKKFLKNFVIAAILFIISTYCEHLDINYDIDDLGVFSEVVSIIFCGFLGMSLTYVIKYFFIKKRKYVSGAAIFVILVSIATVILELYLYFRPVDSWLDLTALVMFLLLFLFTGPLILGCLLYYHVKKKINKEKRKIISDETIFAISVSITIGALLLLICGSECFFVILGTMCILSLFFIADLLYYLIKKKLIKEKKFKS